MTAVLGLNQVFLKHLLALHLPPVLPDVLRRRRRHGKIASVPRDLQQRVLHKLQAIGSAKVLAQQDCEKPIRSIKGKSAN